MNSELDYAKMEAARNRAAFEYFEARPQLDAIHNRRIFEAGFARAWSIWQQKIDDAPVEIKTLPNGEVVRVAWLLLPEG